VTHDENSSFHLGHLTATQTSGLNTRSIGWT